MAKCRVQTEVKLVDLLQIHRYHSLPLIQKKAPKRSFEEANAYLSPASSSPSLSSSSLDDLGIENPTYFPISNTSLAGTATVERTDDIPDLELNRIIKLEDVKVTMKENSMTIKHKARAKLKSQIILHLELNEDPQTIRKLGLETKILSKCHFKQSYFQFELPNLILQITEKSDSHYKLSIQISYNIQMLETLYFNIPANDIVYFLKEIIPLISDTPNEVIPSETKNNSISVKSFYDMICEKTLNYPKVDKQPFISELDTDLLKFQSKTVHWLLTRENMSYEEETKSVKSLEIWDKTKADSYTNEQISKALDKLSFGFRIIKIKGVDEIVWYNPYTQNICTQKKLYEYLGSTTEFDNKGYGLLSEEMGLGKTVEIVSLILLNQRPHKEVNESRWYHPLERSITSIKGSLIICPDSIIHQWIDEIELHSPNLSVYVYHGINKSNQSSSELAKELGKHDVILTTYSTISREIHNALFNPSSRPKRAKRDAVIRIDELQLGDDADQRLDKEAIETIKEMYEQIERNEKILRDREDYSSPLVMVEFWRIILDEVQMMGTPVSNICKIATLIPRVHSWGVSGTPIKLDLNDLSSILSFLKIHPFYGSKQNWQKLLSEPQDFNKLFKEISFRHTKEMVKQDISIPTQHKYLLSVPFGPIEQNNYEELYKQFLREVGLDHEGNPINPEWEPSQSYYEYMSYWLKRLRRVCCHANISDSAGTNDRISLKTMDRVLESMIKSTSDKAILIEKDITTSYLEIGQIHEFEKNPDKALEIWSKELPNVQAKLASLRHQQSVQKGKESSNDNPNHANIRMTLNLLHRLYYFIASAHYQLYTPPLTELVPGIRLKGKNNYPIDVDPSLENGTTSPGSHEPVDESTVVVYRVLTQEEQEHQDEEVNFYSLAQNIRRELLSEPIKNVDSFVNNSLDTKFKFSYINDGEYDFNTSFNDLDIQSFITRAGSVLAQLNSQAQTLNKWIQDTVITIKRPLFDSVTDPSGDEYSGSLDDQEKFAAYLDVLQRSIEDRSALVLGKTDSGIFEKFDLITDSANSEFKIALEDEYPKLNVTVSLRNLVISTKSILSNITAVDDMRHFAQLIVDLKKIFEVQKENIENSKKMFRNLNDCFNLRINYFRQLQELSDSVRPFDEYTHANLNPEDREVILYSKIDSDTNELNSIKSRLRYLESLSNIDDQESEKICSICRYPITIGSLTKCGHQYCKDCLAQWLARHRGCPICKAYITKADVYNYTHNREEINVRMITETERGDDDEMFKVYRKIDEDDLNDINALKITNNYGAKVNTIVKQVLWLKKQNPQVQIIVYSQWAQLLQIIGQAFTQNGIRFLGSKTSLSKVGSGGKSKIKTDISSFKKDSRITCFLLNAKAEASGLTLINAQHVFICEPLVNTALELQAISRIHRIGQRKQTSVWMFSITGSVEESIMLLSTRKKIKEREKLDTENYQKNFSKLVEKNGESVAKDDLWNSFFSSKIDRIV